MQEFIQYQLSLCCEHPLASVRQQLSTALPKGTVAILLPSRTAKEAVVVLTAPLRVELPAASEVISSVECALLLVLCLLLS